MTYDYNRLEVMPTSRKTYPLITDETTIDGLPGDERYQSNRKEKR